MRLRGLNAGRSRLHLHEGHLAVHVGVEGQLADLGYGPKTKETVKKAMSGVLLVNEAYYLYTAANNRGYG